MSSNTTRIVIIGGNFAGLAAASKLCSRHDVTLVDPLPEFEWTPNIHELLSGTKRRSAVVLSREDCVARYGHRFVQSEVTHIDTDANSVVTASGMVLPYDALLVAAGSRRDTFGIPGADKHSIGLRWVDDAVDIAKRLDALSRRKRRPSVVIVGGGISGIEAVGEILRHRAGADAFDVHVVEQASRLLPRQSAALGEDIQRLARPFRVHWHTDREVAEVTNRAVILTGGKRLRADLCIWSAGMAMPEFLRDTALADDRDGLAVSDALQSVRADNVFVAGDCARLPAAVPKQAYHAMDMGAVAGENLARFLDGRELRVYRPRPGPLLIAFGRLTTWLVAGELVVASPLLAAAKEGVYQVNMALLASPRAPLEFSMGVVDRAALAARRLLLPQLRPSAALGALTGSRLVL